MFSSFVSLVLVAALPWLGIVAPAQSWEDQVADQIAAIHAEIASDFEYASDMVIGELEPGDADGFSMNVSGNAEYIIIAVCDTDCGDLDMAVYDADEDEAAADIEMDDYPMIAFQGEGEYFVEVLMTDCQAATCLWAAQVFVLE